MWPITSTLCWSVTVESLLQEATYQGVDTSEAAPVVYDLAKRSFRVIPQFEGWRPLDAYETIQPSDVWCAPFLTYGEGFLDCPTNGYVCSSKAGHVLGDLLYSASCIVYRPTASASHGNRHFARHLPLP